MEIDERPPGALLRSLVDSLSSMVAYWDADLRCRFANQAYQRWFGLPPAAVIGRHLSEVLGPLYALNRPYIEGALRGEPQEFEREIPDPAGGPPRQSLASYVPDIVQGHVRGFVVLVTDVSAIKRVEGALRESEERFRLVLDEAPIGMAVVAPDGRFVRVNRALCEVVGYSATELEGLTFQAITHPDDLDADLELMGQLSRGDIKRYQLGKRYLRKDGSVVDIMLTGSVAHGPDGAARYFIAQIEDITERKRLDAERQHAVDLLRQSQERIELALEGAALASWDWNIPTGVVIFNDRWATMRGLRPDEVRPHVDSWLTGLHPEDRPRVAEALAAHFQGATSLYETEHRVRTATGEWRWILDRGKVVARDAGGRPLRMVGTELDVTERKRIEARQALRAELGLVVGTSLELDAQLASIAGVFVGHLADCVILDVDRPAGGRRRVVVRHAEPSMAELCAWLERVHQPRGWTLGGDVRATLQPVLLAEVREADLVVAAHGEDHLWALRELAPASVMVLPLRSRHGAHGVLALVSTTPTRRYAPPDLEMAMELADRAGLAIDNALLYETAQRATQARDEVLGIVAHDLRSPLGTIVIQTELARLPGAPAPQVDVIARAARRMSRLIEDLLDVTRIESGQLAIARVRVPAPALIVEAVEAQRALAAAAAIALRCEPTAALPDVWCDRDRILQVFDNLIGNAVKFAGRGCTVTVGATVGAGEVVFRVSDTGVGIPADDVPHLFDRFWQARKAERRGAGLGLSIARAIVEAHGGRIDVESQPGAGASFTFTIPLAGPGA